MSASPANGTVYQRHPFRRQGSSYGPSHVHNMAVMIAPQKLDYSVTKGGLKTWAVLIIFFLLCSALLAIFSETDQFDDDDNLFTPDDDIETEQETPIESVENVEEEEEEEEPFEQKPIAPDIDDDINDTDNEEEQLFATLLEKAKEATISRRTQQRQRNRPKQRVEEEPVEEKEEEEPVPEPRHIQRRRQRQLELERQRQAEEERLKEQEEDEEDEESNEEDDDENDSAEDKSKEVDDDEDDEPEPTKIPPINKQASISIKKTPAKKPEPKVEAKEKEDDSGEDSDEDDDDDEDEEDPVELVLPKQLRNPRKTPSGISWHKSIQAQQMSEDQNSPRMSLLKGKNRKLYPKLKEPLVDSSQKSDEDDDENDEIDDEELVRTQTRDVVTVRKRTNYYNRKAITNKQDFKHRGKLDNADFLLEKHDFDAGIRLYEEVLKEYKDSPRAHFGIARANQLKSEFQASDSLVDLAINEYQAVLDNYETPDELFRLTADHLIECARFRGNLHKVMTVQRELVDKFPEDLELQNAFGVTFLMMGRPEDARTVFTTILEIDPHNPVAQAYYGYLLKVYDQDFEHGVQYMRKGLRARDEPIQDPKFYFHHGDGLMRLGRNQDALKVHEEAVELGLFPSVYQRSTYNLDGLTARPWWTLSQTHCARHLKNIERQWTIFREEALNAWNENTDLFTDEDAHITTGVQRALWIRTDNSFNEKNCKLVPTICQILKELVEESNCDKGDIKISVMLPGSRVWPHCGATNFVLEAQLGLVSPSEARVRVAKEIRGWKTGKFLIFDKSFEHELWFEGASSTSLRMILSIELWHPEVPLSSRVNTLY